MARSLSCRHMTAVAIVLLASIIHSEALNSTTNSTNATTATGEKSQNATRRIFEIDESGNPHDKRSPVDGLLGLAAPLLALGGGGDGILKSLLGLGLSTLGVGNSDYGGSSYSSSPDGDYSQSIHRHGSPAYSHVAYPSQLTQVSINPLEILQTLATKGAMLGSALNAIKGVILGGSKLLSGAIDQGNSGYEAPIAVIGPAGYPAYRVPHGVLLKGDGGHSQEAAIGSVRYENGRTPLGYLPMSTHYIDGPLQVPSSNQFRHPFSGFDDGTDGVLKRPPTYDDHLERYPYQRPPTKVGSKRRRPSKTNIGASDIGVTSYPQKGPYTPEENVTGLKGKVNAVPDKDNQRVVTASYSVDDSQIGKTTQSLKNLNQFYPKNQSYKIPVKEHLSKENTKDARYDTKQKYGAYSYGGLLNPINTGTSLEDGTSNFAHRVNKDMLGGEQYDGSDENRFSGNDFSIGLGYPHNMPSLLDGNFGNEYQGTSNFPSYHDPIANSHYNHNPYSMFHILKR